MFSPKATSEIEDLRIRLGSNFPSNSEICVIVLSTNSDARAVAAICSVLEQAPSTEVVLVNTGIGSLTTHLGDVIERIMVVETSHRQYPGGARNIGIRVTKAPIVAFLAADCLATPGWVALRVENHRTHRSVASALRPAADGRGVVSVSSWASHIAIHHTRMPEVAQNKALLYGLSYDRALFDEAGLFDESVRVGEDRMFNATVQQIQPSRWDPRIVTLHRYPESPLAAIRDLFARGRRQATQHLQEQGGSRFRLFKRKFKYEVVAYLQMGQNRTARKRYGLPAIAFGFILAIVRCVGNIFPTTSPTKS